MVAHGVRGRRVNPCLRTRLALALPVARPGGRIAAHDVDIDSDSDCEDLELFSR
jgi:hypothetical protein